MSIINGWSPPKETIRIAGKNESSSNRGLTGKDKMTAASILDESCQTAADAKPWSDAFIRSQIPNYRWFVTTNFGHGIVARSDSWPDGPENSPHQGIAKFDFIVRRNLPNLQGLRILELGCNAGVISIHMARLGAAEVVGIDCDQKWSKWKEQAEFVKGALEWRCRASYNTRYEECDMRDLPNRDFGTFDAVLALNCLYYLEENEIYRVIRHVASITDRMVIQCNTHDHACIRHRTLPAFMRKALMANGFPVVSVDWPWDRPWRGFWPRRYCRPIVVGTKS